MLTSSLVFATTTRASAETRSLDIYHMHTGEHETIIFKRDGVYDQAGLNELNHILRDWRRNETIKMDPALFDLIWEVYREAGATQPIQIVCGYRAPETNNMLRSRSRGVAKFSQHTLGKAMDFYLPGVPLEKLREIGMKQQVGGVGFYPTSGSPFVHMDTGGVRAWPRMTRDQLVRLFPDGKTLHLPSDGGPPLPGYNQALADYQRRQSGHATMVASTQPGGNGNVFASLFGIKSGEDDEAETASTSSPAAASARPLPAPQSPASQPGKLIVMASLPLPPERPSRFAPGAQIMAEINPSTAAQPSTLQPASTAPHPGSGAQTALLPGGWTNGPAPLAIATPATYGPDAAQIAALKSIDVPLPPAKPQTIAGAMPKPRPALASTSIAPRSVQDAFSALTGIPRDLQSEALLGYAPVASQLASDEPHTTSVARDNAARLQLASLGTLDTAITLPTTVNPSGKQARSTSQVLAKSDRGDPMARLISHVTEETDRRLFDSASSQRSPQIATFIHPDQTTIPQMIAKPTEVVQEGFGLLHLNLSPDRFDGPAVVALTVIEMH